MERRKIRRPRTVIAHRLHGFFGTTGFNDCTNGKVFAAFPTVRPESKVRTSCGFLTWFTDVVSMFVGDLHNGVSAAGALHPHTAALRLMPGCVVVEPLGAVGGVHGDSVATGGCEVGRGAAVVAEDCGDLIRGGHDDDEEGGGLCALDRGGWRGVGERLPLATQVRGLIDGALVAHGLNPGEVQCIRL